MTTLVYGLVVSEHNVSELESCMAVLPKVVVLIVSRQMAQKKANERLQKEIMELLPDVEVLQPSSETHILEGDSYANTLAWTTEVLSPALNELAKRMPNTAGEWCFNITGGTKVLTLPIANLDCWDTWHYKAWGQSQIEVINARSKKESLPSIELKPLRAASYCSLYTQSSSQPHQLNEQKNKLAEWIFDNRIENLAFQKICAYIKNNYIQFMAEPKQAALMTSLNLSAAELEPVITKVSALVPNLLTLDNNEVHFFSSSTKSQRKHDFKWFAGAWLEDLVQLWIEEWRNSRGLSENCYVRDLKIQLVDKQDEAEIDFMVYHKGEAFLIEVKSDVDKWPEVKRQLSHQAIQLGKKHIALFVGPDVLSNLSVEIIRNSKLQNSEIKILSSKQALFDYLDKK